MGPHCLASDGATFENKTRAEQTQLQSESTHCPIFVQHARFRCRSGSSHGPGQICLSRNSPILRRLKSLRTMRLNLRVRLTNLFRAADPVALLPARFSISNAQNETLLGCHSDEMLNSRAKHAIFFHASKTLVQQYGQRPLCGRAFPAALRFSGVTPRSDNNHRLNDLTSGF